MHDINAIESTLQSICCPLTHLSLRELGIQSECAFLDNCLNIRLTAGFPSALIKQTLIPEIEQTLNQQFPKHLLRISFESHVKVHQTQMSGQSLRNIKNTIAIASGKGGVGKSTVCVQLAKALMLQGARVGILDADIYGPSIPLLLDPKATVEIQDDQYIPITCHGIQAISIGYLTKDDSPLIWRGPMLAKAMIQMLNLTRFDNLDYLLIDLPPGTGDIQLSLVQKIPLTGAIIVTTPQTVATCDAQKALRMFQSTHIDVLGVIENMSMHTCNHCGHQDALFGEGGASQLCQTYSTPLLGKLPLDKLLREESDCGLSNAYDPSRQSAAALQEIALKMAIAICKKPLNYAAKFPPVVVE